MALDMTTFAAALKQHYTSDAVRNLVYKDNALHAILPKMTKFGGANLPIPLIFGNPQGASTSFSSALANKTNSQIKAFTITRVTEYSLANIDNQTMEASENDADAFMRAATTEIDGALHTCVRRIAVSEYRDGTGVIGQISAGSTVASPTISLSNASDAFNFEVGMSLQATSDKATLRSAGAQAVITKVDRVNGTLTISGNWSASIAAVAASDYLVQGGDLNAKVSGLDAWLPMPGILTSTAFFGMDRTVDALRLGGVNYDGRGLPMEEALVQLLSNVGAQGGRPDKGFMNFNNFASLEKALGSKVIYTDVKSEDGQVGFTGMKIAGPRGVVDIVPDQNCQFDRCYMLQTDAWKLYSLGEAPKLLDSDGMKFLRVSSADAVEVRIGAYLQMATGGPGLNGVVQLA